MPMFHRKKIWKLAVFMIPLAGLGAANESRATQTPGIAATDVSASCRESDYAIALDGAIGDQWIGFSRWSVIGVQLEPPAGTQIVAIDYTPSVSPTGSPDPVIGEDYILFERPPAGEQTDYTVVVRYRDIDDPEPPAELPSVPIVFKPRRDCPT